MISDTFHSFVYVPLYNALIGILSIGPWVDLGIAVIVLTVLVKFALYPLSLKASRAQRIMKELEGPLKEIQEKYKENKEEQGRKMLELYRGRGVNPFSSFLVLLIQIPFILGLYFVFLKGGLPNIQTDLLYGFIEPPVNLHTMFLGMVDMVGKSVPLAVLAGVTQYMQAHIALPKLGPRNEKATFQEDFARSMQVQMKFMFPFIIGFVAYWASAAVALYWITSNIFAIGQEMRVKHQMAKERDSTATS